MLAILRGERHSPESNTAIGSQWSPRRVVQNIPCCPRTKILVGARREDGEPKVRQAAL